MLIKIDITSIRKSTKENTDSGKRDYQKVKEGEIREYW